MDSQNRFGYEQYQEAAGYIQSKTKHKPTTGMILGSGLNPLAEEIDQADYIPYQEIPHFPHSTVHGHAGRLVIGEWGGKTVLAMQGRAHFYEGYSIQHLTLPVRVMQMIGIKNLIVTNAAGGVNSNFKAGDLMIIADQLNFVGMSGYNPLRGPNLDEFGPRFPNMTQPYNLELIRLALKSAQELGLDIHQGVYAFVAGPSFETPAEIRFLSTAGADAVGMSTVPEVIVANHSGMRVLGISSITNVAVRETGTNKETTHEEVLQMSKLIVPKLMSLLKHILPRID